ncbi:putative membrane protein [Mycobacterium ulcerans str. Harvey]|uniref:Membrane protein n=1 Tax=Mycobacterium ulcerans str. Harvey TaxID=1299332 RepID=A0ABP3AI74_MYCUL|nr:putative membrane protein [Mycobacterium ulcerans str. Harvey]
MGYSAGSLGTPPQSYNGVGITIAVLTIVAALVFVLPIIVALFLA